MKYQIDQSIKIEQTEADTVLVICNGSKFSVVLKAKEKRLIQTQFRLRGEPRNFIVFTFSALLVLLFKYSHVEGKVVLDREYKGYENVILDRLTEYFRGANLNFEKSFLEFKSLGKNSPAHVLGARITTGKEKPNKVVKLGEVMALLFSKKKDRASKKDLGALNCGLITADRRPSRSISPIVTQKHKKSR